MMRRVRRRKRAFRRTAGRNGRPSGIGATLAPESKRYASGHARHPPLLRSISGGRMMTWHDFVMQLLLIVAPAAILTLIQLDRRR
jgi:hypothetical protein